jgi:hypothetical protein
MGQPLDIALVSYSVSLPTASSKCPSWVFGLLRIPVRPQDILILASHAWVGQLVARDARATRSVSIGMYSLRPGSRVFIYPLGGIALCDGVRKGEPAARVRVHSGGRLRGSLRKADYSTDDDAESSPMSKLRGSSKEAEEVVVHT